MLKKKNWFLNPLRKNWVTLVTVQLPPDCWDKLQTNESGKRSNAKFEQGCQKTDGVKIYGTESFHWPEKERFSFYAKSCEIFQIRKQSVYNKTSHDNDKKEA